MHRSAHGGVVRWRVALGPMEVGGVGERGGRGCALDGRRGVLVLAGLLWSYSPPDQGHEVPNVVAAGVVEGATAADGEEEEDQRPRPWGGAAVDGHGSVRRAVLKIRGLPQLRDEP